jgi:hypothetical protein
MNMRFKKLQKRDVKPTNGLPNTGPILPRLFYCLLLFSLALFASRAAGEDMPVRAIDHGKLAEKSVGQPSPVGGTQKG